MIPDMDQNIRILMLEDSEADAGLIEWELRTAGMSFSSRRVDSEDAFVHALDTFKPDLIFSDNSLPGFDGATGLKLAQQRLPEVPVIFVSGTIGEERAVALLKQGATDYVLKDGRARLVPAVQRALREVSERQERQSAQERYRSIFENAILGICQTTPEGRFLSANNAMALMLGYGSPEELVRAFQAPCKPAFYVDPGAQAELAVTLAESGDIGSREAQVYRRDRRRIWISQSVRAVADNSGEIVCHEVFARDITRRKELEIQMLRAQRMESIGTLASGVAHDLNNILAPIFLSAPLLNTEMSAERRRKIVSMIEASAQRGADIVRQVLAFGRGIDGERQMIRVDESLAELVKMTTMTFPKGIAVRSTIPPGLWRILGDPTQLHQVLLNLCVNARDAMPDGGTLGLSASNRELEVGDPRRMPDAKPGPYVVIEVSDTGSGMPPEILERVFDPFFTTKPVGRGTGLGLSTAVGIVKSHGGWLDVKTEPGRGTIFRIFLPATRAEISAPPEVPDPVNIARGDGRLVLLVDDEVAIGIAAQAVLEGHGFRVLRAAHGVDGLAVFKAHAREVSAVITDVMMPFMDGAALIRALHEVNPDIPIIASTGQGEKAMVTKLKALNVTSILHKPYAAGALLRTLHIALQTVSAGGAPRTVPD